MTAATPHRLAPRAGEWKPFATGGYGGLTCALCGERHQRGWGFFEPRQPSTCTAFACAGCATALVGEGS